MLLDTDVLIDVALDRHPHADAAAELLDRLERGRENAFIAWHTVSNFYYLVAPTRGGPSARDFIVELTRFVEVAATDTRAVRFAAALPMRDFEDAMQVAAARACGAQHIVTRNVQRLRPFAHPRHSPHQQRSASCSEPETARGCARRRVAFQQLSGGPRCVQCGDWLHLKSPCCSQHGPPRRLGHQETRPRVNDLAL